MREEIRRITKMVEEGKLTAEEAAELIDAITAGGAEGEPETAEQAKEDKKEGFDTIFETIDRATRDVLDRVNWQDIAEKIRTASRAGWERVKTDLEQISKGEWKGIFGARADTKKQETPLSIAPGATFHVEVTRGDVRIKGGATEPKVCATAEIRGRDDEEVKKRMSAWAMMIEENGKDVTLRTPGVASGASRIDLDVYLPEGVEVDVKTTSGDVSVTDTKAPVRVQNASGDVSVTGPAERLWVQSSSGDIAVKGMGGGQITIESRSGDISFADCKAGLNVRTASGDLELRRVTGSPIALETISGDIDIVFSEPVTGKCSLRSVSGDIRAEAPDGSSCRVSLSSLNGSVECGLPLEDEIKAERRITGRCGEGEGSIDASAISGDVTLEMKTSNE